MPSSMLKIVKQGVKEGDFASTSEFFRDLVRQWNTHKLAQELKKDRQNFKAGRGKELKSLKDLR